MLQLAKLEVSLSKPPAVYVGDGGWGRVYVRWRVGGVGEGNGIEAGK